MWWFHRTDPSHAPCEAATRTLLSIIKSQEEQISKLNDRLISMHSVGISEHERALQERIHLGELQLEQMKKAAAKTTDSQVDDGERLDVDSILDHDPDKAHSVESFSRPKLKRRPDPESVMES